MAFVLAWLWLGSCTSGGREQETRVRPSDAAQALTPLYYPDSRPLTRWWWFAEPLEATDIRAQLHWIRDHGFGGVEIAWVYPLDSAGKAVPPDGTPAFLGSEWQASVVLAAHVADSLGLHTDWTFGSLWPFGGSFVPAADATKDLGDTATGQFIRLSWEHPKRGRVLNHLDPKALERYADTLFAALQPAFPPAFQQVPGPTVIAEPGAGAAPGEPLPNRRGLFCDSWEVHAGSLWTDAASGLFQREHGYRLEDTLAHLAGLQLEAEGALPLPDFPSPERAKRFFDILYDTACAGILYDYRKVVAQVASGSFYAAWTDRAHAEGAFTRAQAAGSPTDLLEAYAAVDVPESEALLFEPHFSRIPASAAAWSGKAELSAEAFTCLYGWDRWPGPGPHHTEEQAEDVRLLADALFANGVNQLIWHGTPYQKGYGDADSAARAAWDPRIFFASVHAAPGGALEPELADLNAYFTQISRAMKRGKPFARVGVLLPLEDAWRAGPYGEPEQSQPGSWGAFEMRYVQPPEALRGQQPLWISGHFLQSARGPQRPEKLEALVLDQAYLDHGTLLDLLALAREGLPMALLQIPCDPGAQANPGYADSLQALLALPMVVQSLAELPLPTPLVEAPAGKTVPPFWAREEADCITLFVPHPMARNLRYPMDYGLSQRAAAMDSTERIRIHAFGQHELSLRFQDGRSKLLSISAQGVEEQDWSDLNRLP
jgi:hypothetical protein